jgi:hypothetical protein
MGDVGKGRDGKPQAGPQDVVDPADANISFADAARDLAVPLVHDHEVSHQNGARTGGRRSNCPRSCIGPPHAGQTSRASPVNRW